MTGNIAAVRHGAGQPWAEEVDHVRCKVCIKPYTDSSRNSEICPTCRADPAVLKALRRAKYQERKARGLKG